MKISGNINLKYKSNESAKIVFNTLKIDNKGFIKSKRNNNTIKCKINSKSLGSFLGTADDLIASEIVVEKILTTTNR